MAGLASYLRTGSLLRFTVYALLAATFHRTAVVAVPLIALGNERGRIVAVLILIAVTYLLYHLFLSASVSRFVTNYIDARYASEGAGIRLAMNFVPAVLFLLRSRRMGFTERERRVWRNLAYASVGFVGLLFVVPSSTAVDRLALYAIPLQLAVLSRPRGVMVSEGLGTAIVIIYTAAAQLTWLMFAHHARYWLPYQVWPLFE
jgi:hypothetical protein